MPRIVMNEAGQRFWDHGLGLVSMSSLLPPGTCAPGDGLGQSSTDTYNVVATINNRGWTGGVVVGSGGTVQNQRAYALAVNRPPGFSTGLADNLDYATLARLFGGNTIELTDGSGNTVWYIGGTSVPLQPTVAGLPSTLRSIRNSLAQTGFWLATPNGKVWVDPWIYARDNMSSSQLADLASQSQTQRANANTANCPPYGDITPAQAQAISDAGFRSDCITALLNKANLVPGARMGTQTVVAAAVAAATGIQAGCVKPGYQKPYSTTGAIQPPPTIINGILYPNTTTPTSGPPVCPAGSKIDYDSGGCYACVSACPTGWYPPSQAPACPNDQGYYLYTNAATGCVQCAMARNCVPANAVASFPCPSPLVMAQRGQFMCCVQTPTPGYSAQTQYPNVAPTGAPYQQGATYLAPTGPQTPPSVVSSAASTVKAAVTSTPVVIGGIAAAIAIAYAVMKSKGS